MSHKLPFIFMGKHINENTYDRSVNIVTEHLTNMTKVEFKELMSGSQKDVELFVNNMILTTCEVISGDNMSLSKVDSLPQIKDGIKETLRLSSMNYFIDDVFGDRVDLEEFHLEWGSFADTRKNIALLAPRDHGKSFFWSHLYMIHQMYKFNPTNPLHWKMNKERGMLFSGVSAKAEEFLGDIKKSIEDIPLLREKMLPRGNKGWATKKITTRHGYTLIAKGFSSASRGYHPSTIVVDDGLTDDSLYSKDQREKAIYRFTSVVMQMLVPDGQMAVVGTPFHEMDLYHLFKLKEYADWIYKEYPAITPEGDILWKGRYDFERLMDRKGKLGNVSFSREFLCRALSSEASLFPYAILRLSIRGMENYKLINNIEASPIQFEKVVVGCDFATSANVGADYTVFTVWGIDSHENMWLLYMFRKVGATFNEQIGMIRTINTNFRPQLFVLENNNFQSLYSQNLIDSSVPIKPHTTTGQKNDLKSGLPSMAVLFERGKIKLPYGDERSISASEIIMSEFNSVTFTDRGLQSVSGHDDTCMSAWFGRLAANMEATSGFTFDFLG